jgi:hypothetical protein
VRREPTAVKLEGLLNSNKACRLKTAIRHRRELTVITDVKKLPREAKLLPLLQKQPNAATATGHAPLLASMTRMIKNSQGSRAAAESARNHKIWSPSELINTGSFLLPSCRLFLPPWEHHD